MDPIVEQHKLESIRLCRKLIAEMKKDKEESHLLFSGEIKHAYVAATDKAINKAETVLMKIRNL